MTFWIVFYKSNMVNPTFLMLNITFWGLNVKGRDIQTITGRYAVMADTNLLTEWYRKVKACSYSTE